MKLLLQPLKLHTAEFVDFCKDYYQKLVPEIRNPFYDPETLFKVKEMAGKIVPAISSSNALVAALQVMEAVKLLAG